MPTIQSTDRSTLPATPTGPGSRFSRTPAAITTSEQESWSPRRSRADSPRVSSRAPASIRVIDGAAAQGDQAHERRQPEGGQERHERDLGDAAGGRSGQEPEPHGEEGYDRHRRTSPMTRSASSSVSAG